MCKILGYKYSLICIAICSCESGQRLTNSAEHKWFPVAVLPGASTFTMSLTSGKFDTRIFSMANAIKDTPETESDHAWRDNENYVMSTGEHLSLTLVGQTWEATLDKTPVADSVYIAGLTEASSVATGNFVVSGKKLTFYKDDFNATHSYIDVTYDYIQPAKEAIVTNKESAIGEAVCLWPVYGSGDDCTESDIIGYYIVKVFRARITTIPGMDTSYKSAATFQFELTALNILGLCLVISIVKTLLNGETLFLYGRLSKIYV